MNFDSRLKAVAGAASPVGLLAVLAIGGGASSAGAAPLPNCTPAEQPRGDHRRLRFDGRHRTRAGSALDMVDILATLQPDKTHGGRRVRKRRRPAVRRRSPIGPNLGAIKSALNAVQADNGGTDYEQGFSVGE